MTNPSDTPGSQGPETSEVSPQVAELLEKTSELLERAREPVTKSLSEFTRLELQDEQVYACFELFHTQDYGLNYNEFFISDGTLDVEYNQMYDSDESFVPELNDFMRAYFADSPDRLGQAEGIQFDEQHRAQMLKWFSECWLAAGGDKSRIPTYFAFEKEYQVHDLATDEAMTQAEAARRLGFTISD